MNNQDRPESDSAQSAAHRPLESLLLVVIRDHVDKALFRPMTNLADTMTRQRVEVDPRLEPIRQALRSMGLLDEGGVESVLHTVISLHYLPMLVARAAALGCEDNLPPFTRPSWTRYG